MADKQAKHNLVEQEIVESEKKYCRDITIFLDVYIRPLIRHARGNARTACLTEVEAAVLECGMENVLHCTKELLRQLEEERNGAPQPKTIGRVFMDETEHMRRAYVDFVSGYRAALDLHSDLLNRKKRKGASISYHSFIRNCSQANDTFVGGRIFTDFFILPIQRIPRYRLLLEELLKRSSSRYERAYAKEAIKRISIIADEMNYRLRKTISVKQPIRHISTSVSSKDDEEQLDTIEEENEADTAEETALDASTTENESEGGATTPAHENSIGKAVEEEEEEEEEPDATDSPATRYKKQHAKEIRLDSWLEYRSWKGENLISAPTSNSFALYALAIKGNPWKSSQLAHMNAASLATRLVELYVQLKAVPSPYKPIKGDVVVIGPIRSGQTPVLQALECYSLNTFTRNPHSILNNVGFISWEDWDNVAVNRFRIIKAHADLKAAFGGVLNPSLKGSRPEWKVIVTLRHPADLRMSFFRHVRRMFRKLNPELNFDRMAVMDEFALCIADYESFVADALKVAVEMQSAQVCILFYEELIASPVQFVQRIANFVEYQPDNSSGKKTKEQLAEDREAFIRNVALSITSTPFFVGYSSRVGSVNQGKDNFSRSALAKMEIEWDTKIRPKFNQFSTYEKLYCSITGSATYPYGNEEEAVELFSHDSKGTLHKSVSFTFFNRARAAPTTTGGREGSGRVELEEPPISSGARAGGGSFLGLGRFAKALSFSSEGSEHDGSTHFEPQQGTSRDKAIDPDDSDDEIPDDIIQFWNQEAY